MSEASRIPPRPLRPHVLILLVVAVALGTLPLGAAPAAGEQSALLVPPPPDPSGGGGAQACPCSGPAIGGVWRSHGQYVSCVTRSARSAARSSETSPGAARRAIRDGARASCGKGVRGEGDVRVCGTNPVLPCPTVRTARVDDCTECAAALAGELVRCARVATPAGERDVCGERSLRGASNPAVLEIRTGVDCASCKAKLGTPQAPGLDCLVAACGSALP
jgi:hypothetical protein